MKKGKEERGGEDNCEKMLGRNKAYGRERKRDIGMKKGESEDKTGGKGRKV